MPSKKKKSIAAANADEKKAKSPIIIIIVVLSSIVVLSALAFIACCVYFYSFDFNGTILKNVTVAGVNVGGMTRQEAIKAIEEASAEYETETMTVQVFDTTVAISPDISGARLNTTLAVWDAYKYGRRGFSSQKQADLALSEIGEIIVDITPYLHLDSSAVKDALSEFGNHYSTTLSQSTYEVKGTAPDLSLVVHLGIPEYALNLQSLYDQVLSAYNKKLFLVETTCELIAPSPLDLKAILDSYYVAPVDASYNEKFDIIEGKNGCGFDIDSVQKKLDSSAYGDIVEIPFDIIEPETTTETLSSMLYRDTLGSHTATQSSSSNRQTNLRLACEAINGVILYPGDIFSYNETLGERTTEKGYKAGASYSGGETITTIGGGICQVSSTLYYCALQADLEIIKRENHSYAPGYVPLGMDATVSWGYLDFCFRNNQDYPIRIDASADGGTVIISLVGTDTKDYYIKMEYSVTAYYGYKTTYQTMEANNPKGYKNGDYIVTPYNGYDVVTYRCKYSKATNELISKDYEATSKFAKRDAVICKIENAPSNSQTGETTPGIGNGSVTEDGGSLP